MGQETSKYRKIMRTPQTGENAGKKLWYATAVCDREMISGRNVLHIADKQNLGDKASSAAPQKVDTERWKTDGK